MISVKSSGSYKDLASFLEFMRKGTIFNALDHYGRIGVGLLESATPVDSGRTASSWFFKVEHSKGRHILTWYNSNSPDGVNIAIILQYGHATGTGGWVEGRDYINPAIRPLFDTLVEEIWDEVRDG